MEFSLSSVTVRSLEKRFGDYHAIRGADLSAAEGEFVTLLGESGCGKTTTLRCIAGLETPTAGSITIGDRSVFDSAAKVDVQPERRRTGMVFQSYALWPHLTVLETVMYPLRRRRIRGKAAYERARDVLATVGLEQFATRAATSLSGGQQQRVGVARGLAADPNILLMDEPFGAVDPIVRDELQQELIRLQSDIGKTIVFVTHDIDEAFLLGDQVVLLEKGAQIAQVGAPSEIIANPANDFVASFIGAVKGKRALRLKQTAHGTVVVDAEGRTQGALVEEPRP